MKAFRLSDGKKLGTARLRPTRMTASVAKIFEREKRNIRRRLLCSQARRGGGRRA